VPASTCRATERLLAAAFLAAALAACGPEDRARPVGVVDGSAQCEIFLPGLVPPNFGDGAVTLVLDSHDAAAADASRVTLAQGAAAFAVDEQGAQTIDPAHASYFSIQTYQYTSPSRVELFELRVLPSAWAAGDVLLDGTTAVGFYGAIDFDANGNAKSARILARTTDGVLHLDAAGENPRDPVTATFSGRTSVE